MRLGARHAWVVGIAPGPLEDLTEGGGRGPGFSPVASAAPRPALPASVKGLGARFLDFAATIGVF